MSDKNIPKYCTFHKSSTHDTSECKAKKSHDLKANNENNEEANVITPLPDNFCYAVSSAKDISPSKKGSSNFGYDEFSSLTITLILIHHL
jgi:hypothetical protein